MSLVSAFGTSFESQGAPGEEQLARLVARAASAHPSLAVEPECFAAYLGARAESVQALETMAVEDLYLACACSLGDNAAIETFEARFSPEIALALAKVPDALSMADEITQLILSQLLFPDSSGERAIASYRGRGGLFSWLRVVTVRRALRELGKGQREVPLGDEQILAAIGPSPEFAFIKELYRNAFRQAFASALAELSYQERVLLRHHYVHGLSIDRLSILHKIHRATAARRLASLRERLLVATRRRLLTELRVDSDELDSIMRLIASNLEGSIGGLMSSESEG